MPKTDPMRAPIPPRPAELVQGTWTESALKVLKERYLRTKDNGEQETPEDMLWRVAYAAGKSKAALRTKSDEGAEYEALRTARMYYELMISLDFLPNSPTLMNAGTGNGLQLSACYVLPVEDTIDGIFTTIRNAAVVHKSGGGTGFSFGRLRPKNAMVGSTGGIASGPVSFLRVFDAATEAIKQGGTRRGANMGILPIWHCDVLEFIDCKRDGSITNFNISVAITDDFMRAVAQDSPFDLKDPSTGQVVRTVRAREIFDRLVDAAWATGDPGVIFIDKINMSPANPTPGLSVIEATNPCGEQPLYPYEACNLGSINLANMVITDEHGSRVDWARLQRAAALAVHILDDIIDINPYPLPEIVKAVMENRRIGLGVMGWADMLITLNIPYDSEGARELAKNVMEKINTTAVEASEFLAGRYGFFPNQPHSMYKDDLPRRNATVTTIAPTGTISIIAGCSSGIEPLFALAFRHKAPGANRLLTFFNPLVRQIGEQEGWCTDAVVEKIAETGTLHGIEEIPIATQMRFATAHEIDPENHILMQAAWQSYTENAVSKTINLPNEATRDDVAAAYRLAYDSGCLGITVFRDGCKGVENQVLHTGSADVAVSPPVPESVPASSASYLRPRSRRESLKGSTTQVVAPEGNVNVTINHDEDGPFEVFINVGRAGSDIAALAEAIGRMISLTLQVPSIQSPTERLQAIAAQMRGIGGSRSIGFGPGQVRSLPDAIAVAIDRYQKAPDVPVETFVEANERMLADIRDQLSRVPFTSPLTIAVRGGKVTGNLCPGCGSTAFVMEEGCKKCHACGYSEC